MNPDTVCERRGQRPDPSPACASALHTIAIRRALDAGATFDSQQLRAIEPGINTED